MPGFDSRIIDLSKGSTLKFLLLNILDPAGTNGKLSWQWRNAGDYAVNLERDVSCDPDCWQSFGTKTNDSQWHTYEWYVKLGKVAVDDGGDANLMIHKVY